MTPNMMCEACDASARERRAHRPVSPRLARSRVAPGSAPSGKSRCSRDHSVVFMRAPASAQRYGWPLLPSRSGFFGHQSLVFMRVPKSPRRGSGPGRDQSGYEQPKRLEGLGYVRSEKRTALGVGGWRRSRGSTGVCIASRLRERLPVRPWIHAGYRIPLAVRMVRTALEIPAPSHPDLQCSCRFQDVEESEWPREESNLRSQIRS
jgi:hypothetical protein